MSSRPNGHTAIGPMAAVAALYRGEDAVLAEAILTDLSQQVFHGPVVPPAGLTQQLLARVSLRLLQATTRPDLRNSAVPGYRNRLLERSGHPYATSLLRPGDGAAANLVEGGDPMNGPYLMLVPGIRANGNRWDRLFFNSVQSLDVQRRFILETRATFEAAQAILQSGRPVRMKAVAAGTGLSLILTYDKLIREGADSRRITAIITDRDAANTSKTKHLLKNLASTRGHRFTCTDGCGIAARTEDVFADAEKADGGLFDIVTAVGILEYFEGTTTSTTRERLKLPATENAFGDEVLADRLSSLTSPGGQLVINTYRPHASIRILELFGKRFAYRGRAEVAALLARHAFKPQHCAGSGNIYDVEIFKRLSSEG